MTNLERRAPNDQAVRDQIRADHDATLFVVAGAGTGKTTALVARIVALVAGGATDLTDLAAITFTEAAASELRDRTRAALDRAARGDDPTVTDNEAQQRCASARDGIDDAALCTLHAFAHRIIAAAPIEAGVPPSFEVVDAITASAQFAQRWSTFTDELFDDPALQRPLAQSLLLGIQIRDWRAIATALHDQWDRMPPGTPDPQELSPISYSSIITAMKSALQHERSCTDPDDKLAVALRACQEIHDALAYAEANRDRYDELDLIELPRAYALPRYKGAGRKGSWTCPKEIVISAIGAADDALAAFAQTRAVEIFDHVTPRIKRWVRDGALARAREGTLEFHDLLVLARNMLQHSDRVRSLIAQRYRYLLIDEFQDTDPLQIELALRIAQTSVASSNSDFDWETANVDPGRLFFVGDPKQSIYRFRRADLDLYHRAADRFRDGAVVLTENFRSVPAIIEWVNTTFDAILGAGDPALQATPIPLVAHRAPLTGAGLPVATFGGPSEDRAADVRVAEAADVAAIITEAVGNWAVLDDNGVERPARYGDVAILLPTRTSLDAIDAALDAASITARIESRSLVFATPEVRDLLAIIEAIDDPGNEVAIIAALRSPGFACTDRALAEWAMAGGTWDYRNPNPTLPDSHAVANAFAQLRAWHDQRWWRSVSDTLHSIITDLRLEAVATAHRRPRDRWRRMHLLLEHATAWDNAGADSGLHGFAAWVRQQAEDGASAVEVPVPEADDDAVRILTIHGAKGLEFPIVLLVGLGATPPPSNPSVLFATDRVEYKAGRGADRYYSRGFANLHDTEKQHATAERARLMYVAATRARDHLVVSRHHAIKAHQSHAANMHRYLDDELATAWIPGARASATTPMPAVAAPPQLAPLDALDLQAQLEDQRRMLRSAARPVSVSATQIAHVDTPFTPAPDPFASDDELDSAARTHEALDPVSDNAAPKRDAARRAAAAAIGSAVHAVLQHCDLNDDTSLSELSVVHAQAEGVEEYTAEVALLATTIFQSATVRLAAAHRVWRELPFAATIEATLVEGYIDMLVHDPDRGYLIVDFKTDTIATADSAPTVAQHYAAQLATYALAIEAVVGEPVTEAVLVFAGGGAGIDYPIPDLSAHKDAVRAVLREAPWNQ